MTSEETSSAPPNKAEAEFAKYAQRRRETLAASENSGSGDFPSGSLSWAVPVGVSPMYLGGPPGHGGRPGPSDHRGAESGGLAESVGTTLRLGVDLLNAAIFNSVKVLGGFATAYGAGHPAQGGCGCGYESCCQSCCEPSCCDCDCDCCNPGVGTCC